LKSASCGLVVIVLYCKTASRLLLVLITGDENWLENARTCSSLRIGGRSDGMTAWGGRCALLAAAPLIPTLPIGGPGLSKQKAKAVGGWVY